MQPRPSRWPELFLVFAILLGGAVRFAPTLLARSVINDGGLFYVMMADLKANGFLLPAFTSYNHLQIPFAYPPLSLYVGALLSAVGVPAAEVLRWLPALVSTASLLAFYWMSSQVLASRSTAALATLAYALLPRSFSWYVMGGGLSRSFGVLFLLLTCGSAFLLFSKSGWKRVLATALFGAGALLSHPETGLHTAVLCGLIWLARGRTARGLRDALLVAAGVLLFTSPWWGAVLAHHGLGAFGSALNTGGHGGLFWLPWLTFDFGEERFVSLLTVLGLIGLAVQLTRREWLLPAWLLLPFAAEPRSATAIAALPLAMLAGKGLAEFVLPRIAALAGCATEGDWTLAMTCSRAARLVMAYVLLAAFLGAFAYDTSLATYAVPPGTLDAMRWVRANVPSEARFLVVSGAPDPFSDPAGEWFPALAERRSESTIQGMEWTLGSRFMPFLNSLDALQACLNASPSCLDDWAASQHVGFDHVLIQKPHEPAAAAPSGLLLYQMRTHPAYELIYENPAAAVFAKR